MDSVSASPPEELVFLSTYLLSLLPPSLPLKSTSVLDILMDRFLPAHWHSEAPERGSGYRAISFEPCRRDGYVDPVVAIAAQAAGWTSRQLRKRMVLDTGDRGRDGWTVFVDPGCVCIRGISSDLRELWGSLPSYLKSPPHLSASPIRINVQPRPGATGSSPSFFNGQTSPFKLEPKQSRAVPILAPSSALRNAGVVKMGVIPPTPLASRQDSTSPSKPSSVSPSRSAGVDSDVSWDASEAEDKMGPIAPLQLLAPFSLRQGVASAELDTPSDAPNNDPFHRPSSRSSSGSASEEYASDASLFSNRSSATSDATTILDAISQYHAKASAPSFASSQGILRNKPSQMVISCHPPTASLDRIPSPDMFASGSTSPSAQSMPASPRKPSLNSRGRFPSMSLTHGHSSSHGLVLKGGPGTVTEHSGGKVGVMGGGVLLGVPKSLSATASNEDIGAQAGASASSSSNDSKVRRRGGRRGRGGAGAQQYSVHQGQWPGAGLSISSIASFASAGSAGSMY